ncbi:MAG: zinc ribbon domain-containing protein [Deltaproteobacteria bacterium]|nr:zinc ribbon domain-containing protein [Deltaproteobacteria bacterium]
MDRTDFEQMREPKRCPYCGKTVGPDFAFCPYCGKAL